MTAVVAIALAFVTITLVSEVPEMVTARGHAGEFEGLLRVLPGAALIALTSATVSNILGLSPGVVFGMVAGFAVVRGRRSDEVGGKSAALGAASLFSLSMLAWVAWGGIKGYVEHRHGQALGPVFAGQYMEVLIAGCMEAVAFAYIPLRFMDGDRVRHWDRRVWLAIQAAALLLSALLIVGTGRNDYVQFGAGASVWPGVKAVLVALGFGAFSLAFWGYFRGRERERYLRLPDDDTTPTMTMSTNSRT